MLTILQGIKSPQVHRLQAEQLHPIWPLRQRAPDVLVRSFEAEDPLLARRGESPRLGEKTCWKTHGKLMENQGKPMEKPGKTHGKTRENPWKNQGKPMEKPGKTMEKPGKTHGKPARTRENSWKNQEET